MGRQPAHRTLSVSKHPGSHPWVTLTQTRETWRRRGQWSLSPPPSVVCNTAGRGAVSGLEDRAGAGTPDKPSPLLPEKLWTSAQNRERSPPHCERTASDANRASLRPSCGTPEDPQWGDNIPSSDKGFISLFYCTLKWPWEVGTWIIFILQMKHWSPGKSMNFPTLP